jgi:hypothetical protein
MLATLQSKEMTTETCLDGDLRRMLTEEAPAVGSLWEHLRTCRLFPEEPEVLDVADVTVSSLQAWEETLKGTPHEGKVKGLIRLLNEATHVDSVPSMVASRVNDFVEDFLLYGVGGPETTAGVADAADAADNVASEDAVFKRLGPDQDMFHVFQTPGDGPVHVYDWTAEGSIALCLFPNASALATACSAFRQWLQSHGDQHGTAFHLFDVLFWDPDKLKEEVHDWFESEAADLGSVEHQGDEEERQFCEDLQTFLRDHGLDQVHRNLICKDAFLGAHSGTEDLSRENNAATVFAALDRLATWSPHAVS